MQYLNLISRSNHMSKHAYSIMLIATAKLQLFQGQESTSGIVAAAIKNVVWHCIHEKSDTPWQMSHQPYRFCRPCV